MLALEFTEDSCPTFTTPSFDFESHSAELLEMVNQVFEYRDEFWKKVHEQQPTSPTGEALDDKFKEQYLRKAVDRVLVRFNLLTTSTPLKKRAASNRRAKQNNTAAPEKHSPADGMCILQSINCFCSKIRLFPSKEHPLV